MRWLVIVVIVIFLLPFLSFAQECDYKVEILIEGTEFTKESFKWRMKATKLEGASTNITGAARIEDLNGNTIKSYKPWTNLPISKQKTSNEYSPNLKEGDYKIISEIDVDCDDIGKGNNMGLKAIRIKPENMEMQETNTAASPVEEIQEQQNAAQQVQKDEINQTIPEENNSKEYENTANLRNEIVQGKSIAAEPVKNPDKEYTYVSSNEKAKNLIIYFILAVSIILNIALIWKR